VIISTIPVSEEISLLTQRLRGVQQNSHILIKYLTRALCVLSRHERANEAKPSLPAIMHSVLASRIMFNLRQCAYCDIIDTPDMEVLEMESSSPTVLRFSVFGSV
jgi:hypothetical protein